ncbi:ATPase [Actinoplanes sp. SE50]|uniref:MinD/ParA family ATP-binding protein n=1 Tax=unclassified Actinoplanes TaxID=2626549 RepID=UPI00023ECE0B|nr:MULTISPECIES: AAA family ATPase [unclassified Actinoplanes]AEV82672.1 chromosome partitioning ATPase [Actinoplanes sp. SE50/110]ATO81068.1 ATPase [Actinoplanes sp. SE50]SLL98475.1 ATPase [Actinoplanes sp. SE50/110]
MDGTETGWGRPAEPAPRWRALLDRARHGHRAEEPADEPRADPAAVPQQWGQQQPPAPPTRASARPVNPLENRGYEGQRQAEPRYGAAEPQRPMPQRPVNPLDPRWQARPDQQQHSFFEPAPRSPQPVTPPPAPPARADYPPAPGYPPQVPQPNGHPATNGYGQPPAAPHAYAAPPAAPQAYTTPPLAPRPVSPPLAPRPVSPPLAPPVAPPPPASLAPPAPLAPAAGVGARIEWRQTRTDEGLDRSAAVLRRTLGKPRVLAFANPKGGVHKTTATVLAAATIGSVRGRGVLAWDDNELRGTLGLRAGSARHARTIKHLLADLDRIEGLHGDALLQELDAYLRHASDGSYDVLAGEENPRFAQRLDQGTVRRVTDLLRRTHDVICVDTGNNVESVNWQTVMRMADQLVITTVPREDAAFTADWMLDVLEESGMGDMVANAVTLISCPSPGALPLLADFKKHFATRTRAVAVVPYDPALEVGSSIEYGDLQPETRQAWLRAASVMLEPFAE